MLKFLMLNKNKNKQKNMYKSKKAPLPNNVKLHVSFFFIFNKDKKLNSSDQWLAQQIKTFFAVSHKFKLWVLTETWTVHTET